MKLLLDQNLSPRLVHRLADLYPNSSHVMDEELDRSLDREVWNYARQHDYLIVTKDVDFSELSVLLGFPRRVHRTPNRLLSRFTSGGQRWPHTLHTRQGELVAYMEERQVGEKQMVSGYVAD